MLRLQTPDGWWLVTHPDHAHLAGDFAAAWGNSVFAAPEPRTHVLRGIYAHDEGWRDRDAVATITPDGKPAAFSTELVGKYSAFENIDLQAYLTVRADAVLEMAAQDPYAAILISMHTENLLTARADRSTVAPDHLPLLDTFLDAQRALQRDLRAQLLETPAEGASAIDPAHLTDEALTDNFRLLQATDNLSLLSCVDYSGPASLLHPLRTVSGRTRTPDRAREISVFHLGERHFRLAPYPLREPTMRFALPARFVPGKTFGSDEELSDRLSDTPQGTLEVTITA